MAVIKIEEPFRSDATPPPSYLLYDWSPSNRKKVDMSLKSFMCEIVEIYL